MSSIFELREIAGAKITTKFISVPGSELIADIRRTITTRSTEFDLIDYVYVVNDRNQLEGVASLKEILQAPDDTEVRHIMKKNPVTVDFHTDQEKVVYLVIKHSLKAMPVVDEDNHLKGIVPYDTILSVFHHEFREDILRSGGIHHHIKEIEELTTPVSKLVRARLPSLVLGLLGGLLAAYIVSDFEEVIGSYIVLAAFIPVMVYLSDAVGTQSQTLIVRMIALEPEFSIRRYLTRELKIGSVLGLTFAAILFAAATLGWGSLNLGLVIGSAMFFSILFQAFIATFLSARLARSNIDPALASGPLTTIISDITSLTMYFGIASAMLMYFK
jgi:magnesium transporter